MNELDIYSLGERRPIQEKKLSAVCPLIQEHALIQDSSAPLSQIVKRELYCTIYTDKLLEESMRKI